MNTNSSIPLIFVHESSVPAFRTFNPNNWQGASRSIIQSCATEFSVLKYNENRIAAVCRDGNSLCQPYFDNLSAQWKKSPWDFAKTVSFGQVPELHVLIEGFFAGLKSLLDLSVQLLTTEGIVRTTIDGFHRDKEVYGGTVLNVLERNVPKDKKTQAKHIRKLIITHKERWIDQAITTRDQLVHPIHGAQQVMFVMRVAIKDGLPMYDGAVPPHIGTTSIAEYASARNSDISEFCRELFVLLREAA